MNVYVLISTYFNEGVYQQDDIIAIHLSEQKAKEHKTAIETMAQCDDDEPVEYRVDVFTLVE